ncbi:MAG TPA: hypothetical protein VK582_15775 [Pyrinomonadaceae bacterium]|nr:hypothetical protein [Pyrinomonadaceae bacterium]
MNRTIRMVFGVALALLSVFFVFYTARLLYVTHGLTAIRTGGQGAYVGAVVFPLLAILFGWGAWRLLRSRK